MSGHTRGPWTLKHVQGNNFAVQEFEIRGMFGDSPGVAPIFNKDISAIDGTTFCASPQDAKLIAASPDMAAILDELEGAFDEQTYQEKVRADFDLESDHEFSVTITAKQLRAIGRACNKAGL